MSAPKRIEAFLTIAEDDLKAARLLAEQVPGQAAFFLQQSAEEAIRALLTHLGIPFGTSHNIRSMADALPKEHALRQRILDLDRLSPAATRYRYPSAEGKIPKAPEASTVRKGADDLAAFLDEVRQSISGADLEPKSKSPGLG